MPLPALPALTRTYSCRANVPFQANDTALNMSRSMMFSLVKHMLDTLAGGTTAGSRHANSVWTVRYSCNSVTAGVAGDGIDRWTTIANLVFAANGAAHSWFVMENTTLGYQVCVDLNNAAGTNVGFVAAEIATPFTGGTTTTRPTATNEFLMGTTSTGGTANFIFITDVTTGNFNWTHYITANTGEFYFLSSRTGLGFFSTSMKMQKTTNPQTGDTRNVFLLGHSLVTGRGAPSYGALVQAAAGCVGRNVNGSVNTTGGIQNAGTFGATAWPGSNGIDAVSGNYPAYPCHVSSLGTQEAYRGQLPDLFVIGTAPTAGSVPSSAAQTSVIAGDFVVPFPTVNPTV
mgnify:FL=1